MLGEYSQWNSHLIGIMIINHWVQWGTQHFQTHPHRNKSVSIHLNGSASGDSYCSYSPLLGRYPGAKSQLQSALRRPGRSSQGCSKMCRSVARTERPPMWNQAALVMSHWNHHSCVINADFYVEIHLLCPWNPLRLLALAFLLFRFLQIG